MKKTTCLSKVMVLALALRDEVIELRREELGGHGGRMTGNDGLSGSWHLRFGVSGDLVVRAFRRGIVDAACMELS